MLEEIAQAHNASIAQVALNWLLAQPGVTSVIVGARREEQLVDNLKAATWTMTAEEVERARRGQRDAADLPVLAPAAEQHAGSAAGQPSLKTA